MDSFTVSSVKMSSSTSSTINESKKAPFQSPPSPETKKIQAAIEVSNQESSLKKTYRDLLYMKRVNNGEIERIDPVVYNLLPDLDKELDENYQYFIDLGGENTYVDFMLKHNNGNPNYSSQGSQSHDYTYYPSDSTFNMDSSDDSLKSFISEQTLSSDDDEDDDHSDKNDASTSTVLVCLHPSGQKLPPEGETSNPEKTEPKNSSSTKQVTCNSIDKKLPSRGSSYAEDHINENSSSTEQVTCCSSDENKFQDDLSNESNSSTEQVTCNSSSSNYYGIEEIEIETNESPSHHENSSLLLGQNSQQSSQESTRVQQELTTCLRHFIDSTKNEDKGPWKGEIIMDVTNGYDIYQTNILKHVGDITKKDNMVLDFFSPFEFPVTKGFVESGLYAAIGRVGKESGFIITLSGEYTSQNHGVCWRVVCDRKQKYRGDVKKRVEQTYRDRSYINNRKHSRKAGKSMPKKTITKRAICKEEVCNFHFYVSRNAAAFYIVPGIGNVMHTNHPKNKPDSEYISLPSRFLYDNQKELICDVGNAHANLSVAVNMIWEKTKHVIDYNTVRYLHGLHNGKEDVDGIEKKNSTHALISFLQKNNYKHMVLYDEGDSRLSSVATDTSGSSEKKTHEAVVEEDDLSSFVSINRTKQKVGSDQKMLIATAWTIPGEEAFTYLFPETWFMDTVQDTNDEERPLFTITAKDSEGYMFTVLRVYMPNQKQWAFNWIFQEVIPKLIGKDVLCRVNHIITDGDVCETSQLDNALDTHFPNASRGRCGYHLVSQGWKKHVKGPKAYKLKTENYKYFGEVTSTLKNWLYTWMKPNCETEQEYEYSRNMFYSFLRSNEVKEKCSEQFCSDVTTFVSYYLDVHKKLYCFYNRKYLLHFDEYSNSAHEGTNRAIKYCAAPVGPTTPLPKSAEILSTNGKRNVEQKKNKYNKDLHGTKLYSDLQCKDDLTSCGFQQLLKSWMRKENYKTLRIAEDEWLIAPSFPDPNVPHNLMYPVYYRVRHVKLKDGFLFCVCGRKERIGIPCPHIYKVLSTFDNFKEPSHHDCHIRWWNIFLKKGFDIKRTDVTQKEKDFASMLKLLSTKEKSDGVHVDSSWIMNEDIHQGELPDDFIYDAKIPRCINYKNFDAKLYEEYGGHVTNGYSQISNVDDNQDEEDAESILLDRFHALTRENHPSFFKKDPYHTCKPSFDELMRYLHPKHDIQYIKNTCDYLTEQAAEAKARHTERCTNSLKKTNRENSEWVSSNATTKIRKLTHGAKKC